jgi:hypothetical protein
VSSVVSSESPGDLERVYDVLEVKRGRVVRVLTCLFPKYFAVVTRVRQEVRSMDQGSFNMDKITHIPNVPLQHILDSNVQNIVPSYSL